MPYRINITKIYYFCEILHYNGSNRYVRRTKITDRQMELLRLFGQIDRQMFVRSFKEEQDCLAFLAEEKWKDGYVCRNCGHTNYCKGKKLYSRRCTRCKREESPTAHTIFHHCRIPLPTAFEIAFLVCTTPGLTVAGLSRELATRQMTCWKFRKQVLECLEAKRSAIPQFEK